MCLFFVTFDHFGYILQVHVSPIKFSSTAFYKALIENTLTRNNFLKFNLFRNFTKGVYISY